MVHARGQPMGEWDWGLNETVTVAVYLNGDGIADVDGDGNAVVDDSFLVLVNAYWDPVPFTVPDSLAGPWGVELDTSEPGGLSGPASHAPGEVVTLSGRSMLVLRRPRGA